MPTGSGWWLNSHTGDTVPVTEHTRAIAMEPERFGFLPDDPRLSSGHPTAELRIQVASEAMLRGWVRIRDTGGRNPYRVAEVWSYDNKIDAALVDFFSLQRAWDVDRLVIKEVRPHGGSWSGTIGSLRGGEVLQQFSAPESAAVDTWKKSMHSKFGIYDSVMRPKLQALLKECLVKSSCSHRFWVDGTTVLWESVGIDPRSGLRSPMRREEIARIEEALKGIEEESNR